MDKKIKVLIVDDQILFFDVIQMALHSSHPGKFELHWLTSIEDGEALVDCVKEPFDCILYDIVGTSFRNLSDLDAKIKNRNTILMSATYAPISTSLKFLNKLDVVPYLKSLVTG